MCNRLYFRVHRANLLQWVFASNTDLHLIPLRMGLFDTDQKRRNRHARPAHERGRPHPAPLLPPVHLLLLQPPPVQLFLIAPAIGIGEAQRKISRVLRKDPHSGEDEKKKKRD